MSEIIERKQYVDINQNSAQVQIAKNVGRYLNRSQSELYSSACMNEHYICKVAI